MQRQTPAAEKSTEEPARDFSLTTHLQTVAGDAQEFVKDMKTTVDQKLQAGSLALLDLFFFVFTKISDFNNFVRA